MKIDVNTHMAGEYFVAAELYRRGFSVGMTIGNAKAIDILAQKNGVAIQIQVKAILRNASIGWTMNDHDLHDHIMYILVNLNECDQPDYYIFSAAEIRTYHKQYRGRGILDLSKAKRLDGLGRWDKLEINSAKDYADPLQSSAVATGGSIAVKCVEEDV